MYSYSIFLNLNDPSKYFLDDLSLLIEETFSLNID